MAWGRAWYLVDSARMRWAGVHKEGSVVVLYQVEAYRVLAKVAEKRLPRGWCQLDIFVNTCQGSDPNPTALKDTVRHPQITSTLSFHTTAAQM